MKNNQYRASIKVVGTVLPETKLILNKYLELKDLELLKKEVLDNNLILKTSKRRAETIYYEIRKRYLKNQIRRYNEDPFIYLIKNINTDSIIDLILYYHLCKEEKSFLNIWQILFIINMKRISGVYFNRYYGIHSELSK